MLTLTVVFLVGLYVAKIFFPQEFMMSIQNEKLIMIGAYIDSHKWLYYICTGITAFITYWLFMCACKRKLYLNLIETLIIVLCVIILRLVYIYDVNLYSHLSVSSFFIIPLICKFDLKIATLIYFIHGLSQVLSLFIRELPMYLTNINFITTIFMVIEMYFWLILFYIIFNYKNKESSK